MEDASVAAGESDVVALGALVEPGEFCKFLANCNGGIVATGVVEEQLCPLHEFSRVMVRGPGQPVGAVNCVAMGGPLVPCCQISGPSGGAQRCNVVVANSLYMCRMWVGIGVWR